MRCIPANETPGSTISQPRDSAANHAPPRSRDLSRLLLVGCLLLFLFSSCDYGLQSTASKSPNDPTASSPHTARGTSNASGSDIQDISPRDATPATLQDRPSDLQKPSIKLSISVSDSKHASGKCLVAIYTSRTGFNNPEYAIAKTTVDLENGTAKWEVALPADQADITVVAVSAFLDSNTNGVLDKNSFGIPIETYGFSNNPKRGFGPPRFDEVAAKINPTNGVTELSIQIY